MEISLFCHWCDRYHFIFNNIRLATQLKKTAVSFYMYMYIYIYIDTHTLTNIHRYYCASLCVRISSLPSYMCQIFDDNGTQFFLHTRWAMIRAARPKTGGMKSQGHRMRAAKKTR